MNAYQIDAWIEAQLKHRLPADFQNVRQFIIDDAALMAMKSIKDISIFDAGRNEFLEVNDYDRMLALSATDRRYHVVNANPSRPAQGRRDAEFAILLLAMNLSGIFVSNWCDAQGWGYKSKLPELKGLPIIQYCRRPVQRDQVCLMPLSYDYMGPGGKNLPGFSDTVPFTEKKSMLTWRGRFSGTVSDWDSAVWWAESVLRTNRRLNEEDMEKIKTCARKKIVDELMGCEWADVKLTCTPREVESIAQNEILANVFSGCIAPRISMSQQRQSKFLLVVDGNDIGTNKYWSLLSNSVVLMVRSEWETALDAGLEPGKHFILVEPSIESIEAAIQELNRDEDRCLQVIHDAHELMRPHLNSRLREAVDFLTLKKYAETIILPFGGVVKDSFARGK